MTDIIKLNDLLKISNDSIPVTRVKLNVYNGNEEPLEAYKRNPKEINDGWFLWRGEKRHYRVGYIAICLLDLGWDRWLLTTIKKITAVLDVKHDVGYEAEEIPEYKKYYGRIIVRYHNNSMQMVRKYESLLDDLKVAEILPTVYDGDEFPGYENIRLTFSQLSAIINGRKSTWLNALQSQKAVYLITDRLTGKHYVGSATSQSGMLLQRWSAYVDNGHGGNVELKKLVAEKGFDYIKGNFQYAVLENYNPRMDDSYILRRESWWKNTLCSREHGYNAN